ncbi:bacterial low temperature requirement A protein-domain-containing protein [Clohesyomyces aquaticus]|uniref:Bacterial low temperature requirement A protein-domain-containing protein n=1 Tax=Clohesyomyces aquaticus TaxID=1231657 RepID=A0A1Y1ZJW1_9PLEO|nr:bacterial low temperature requirement A protein-domain-containing protein [Clohesyomyces aquaticus]
MGHEEALSFFASPLHEGGHTAHGHGGHGHGAHDIPMSHHSSEVSNNIEEQKNLNGNTDSTAVPFNTHDESLHDNPGFHRHAEATTAELFYDLFFVANLTTFTSLLEINDHNSLTAYIGFFCLLWLTWYQVSLFDVRFSTDSIFERCAKAIHFGTMVGFAVIGPQWNPGQEIYDYKIYKAFSIILMVSRLTLFLQYAVTLFFTKKYTKTRVPLLLVMGSCLISAIIYGALTGAFPHVGDKPVKSNVYIAWYIIGISETILTVFVSCIWRVISFKGTHMVQRMSLLSLIILGEGIIVICKAISKIVKLDYLWSAAVIGQIIAAILIIYFLYMLYFDRMSEEHFGSIKQQIWSFLHFPLHTSLVLVLQGVSLLVIWCQAIIGLDSMLLDFGDTVTHYQTLVVDGTATSGAEFSEALYNVTWGNVFNYVPKGVDATKEIDAATTALASIADSFDLFIASHGTNETLWVDDIAVQLADLFSSATKTLFDSFSVSMPKKVAKKENLGLDEVISTYINIFKLVFAYVFVAVS